MTKVYLVNRFNEKDRRDITDIADSWYTAPNGCDIRVNYHHTIINGKRIANRCQILHENSDIIIERENENGSEKDKI